MDIKQLTYFLEIIKEGNITKAAENLHIAQPHLSQQLKLLEYELNTKLVQRSTRKFQITESGKLLQKRGEQIVNLLENTLTELNDLNEGIQGTLSIGTISAKGDTLLLTKINAFHEKYPNVNFIIEECTTKEILELLNIGLIEIGIARTPLNSNEVESIYFPNEPMVAVYYNNDYWDDSKETIDISELADKPLLVNFRFEKTILESCKRYGFTPRIICKINDARSILLWANTGMGVAIIPKDWMDIFPDINFKYKVISEPSLITRTAIIWAKKRYLSSVAKHFLETFISN